MTDFYREVVISLEWLFYVMAFFHLHLANMCFRLREIVSTNKMINISKNLGVWKSRNPEPELEPEPKK